MPVRFRPDWLSVLLRNACPFWNGICTLWDDWKKIHLSTCTYLQFVSIPLWDDWKEYGFDLVRFVEGFNSTMGWLEVERVSFEIALFGGFNSTMGWLEEPQLKTMSRYFVVSIPLWDDWKLTAPYRLILAYLFQFHYGMIGRAVGTAQPLDFGRFNSTMGWLEDWKGKLDNHLFWRFNSTMGWLEGWKNVKKKMQKLSFNSTMGWLEGPGEVQPNSAH